MTNLFKKSALVVALVAAASAQAVTIDEFTPIALSKQKASETLTISGNTFAINPGVAYQVGTEITVTFSGGELTVAPSAATWDASTGGAAVPAAAWTRVAQNATSATFRLSGQAVAATEFVRISGYQHTTSSVLAGTTTVTIAVKADTGVAIDPAGNGDKTSRAVILVGDEYSAKVNTKLDRVIDLASTRTKFVSGDAPLNNNNNVFLQITSTDANGITYKNDANADTTANFAATTTAGDRVYTVKGDFSWVKDTDLTKDGIQAHSSTFTYTNIADAAQAGCTTTEVTAAQLVFTCTSAQALDLKAKFNVYQGGTAAPVALKDGSYTVSVNQKHTSPDGTVATLKDAAAGTWSNNGTTKAVDYLPYGDNISQILYATNLTSEVGAIYLTAYDESGKKVVNGVKIADTKANGITDLATPVKAALKDGGVTVGKVALTFDIESSKATVFAAYNVSGDRLSVVSR